MSIANNYDRIDSSSSDSLTSDKNYPKHLIADYNSIHRYILKRYLEKDNIEVVEVSNTHNILKLFHEGNMYDVIWIDLMLPHTNYMSCVEQLRQNGFIGTIIGLTTDSDTDLFDFCFKNGFDFVIEKPLSSDIIHKYLNESSNKSCCNKHSFIKRGCITPIYSHLYR